MSDKKKWHWQEAINLAEQLKAELEPLCQRIEIAGSLRRRKPMVGDIELLYVPRFEDRQADFFSTVPVSLADERIGQWLASGVIVKRLSVTGTAAWGAENKLALHVTTGIPVDFFATDEKRWWVALVVRTGSKANNLRLATGAIQRGRRFHAYGSGVTDNGKSIDAKSEREAFELCGVPYLEPEKR